jgi:hypothetical protein
MTNLKSAFAVPGRLAPPPPHAPAGTAERTTRALAIATFLAACAASALDLVVFSVAGALWNVPGPFTMLSPASAVVAATIGAVIAGVGLFVLGRLVRNPAPIFTGLIATATLLSLAGPLSAMSGKVPGMLPATTATGVTMIAMHLLTGGVIAAILLRRSLENA